MESFQGKRKSAMSDSLFRTLSESFAPERPSATNVKPPRDFRDGVVGLGIVAAMNGGGVSFSVSSRSSPIPIVSSIRAVADFRGGLYLDGDADSDGGGEVDESSESYTCVISRGGGDSVTKRVYFDGKLSKILGNEHPVVSGVFSASPDFIDGTELEFWTSDFLNICFLCKKQLDGLDIFMYRGEKAFCSWDCRDKHIISDACKEKCSSKPMKSRDYAPSLCTSPQVILAGVAAA